MLRRVAQISPDDREHVVDLAESYLANDRPGARSIGLYTDERPVFEANAGTQAAVDVIRDRVVYEDPVAPGMREFRFPGLVVEGVRLHDVVMRGANAAGCYACCPSGTERTSREATSTSVRSNGRSSPTVFEGANLSDVTFAGADLVGANFVGVKSIAGADFSAVIGVDRALHLANAPGAESAIWP